MRARGRDGDGEPRGDHVGSLLGARLTGREEQAPGSRRTRVPASGQAGPGRGAAERAALGCRAPPQNPGPLASRPPGPQAQLSLILKIHSVAIYLLST